MADRFDLINFGKSVVTTLGGITANVNIDANTLFVDGTNNRVGIGTAAPNATLDVVSSDRKRIRATGVSEEGAILFQNGTTGSGQSNGFLVGIGGDSNAYLLNFHNSPMIFSTNNGERMRIDASGRITTPAQPMFHATGSGMSNISISGASLTQLVLNSTYVNIGTHYSTSTGRFTAPIAGAYFFYGQIPYVSISSAGYAGIQILRNGSPLLDGYTSGSFQYGQPVASIIANLVANDFVDLRAAYSLTSGTIETSVTGRAYFGGYLLG